MARHRVIDNDGRRFNDMDAILFQHRLQSECLADIVDTIQLLPSEELHVDGLRLVVVAGKGLLDNL